MEVVCSMAILYFNTTDSGSYGFVASGEVVSVQVRGGELFSG